MAIAIGAFAIAGCGSGSDDEGTAAVVSVGSVPEIDSVLVTSKGITLYMFSNDKGTQSECYASCSQAISPLLTDGAPRAKGGAIAAKLGTTERRDGTTQVTYAGHPLYTWRDEKPGQRRGWGVNVFEGTWYPLEPGGRAVPNNN